MSGRYDRFHTHRRSRRHPTHDYAAPGWYFVTICTHRRACAFGHVEGGAVHLSAIGRIADACWRSLPAHAPRVVLDAFVVMPNHVHGLLALRPDPPSDPRPGSESDSDPVPPLHATALPQDMRDAALHDAPPQGMPPQGMPPQGMRGDAALHDGPPRDGPPTGPDPAMAALSPAPGSLSVVVRSYKAAVTREARRLDPSFAWQPRFHDRVVRSAAALARARAYVRATPARWERDRLFTAPDGR